jgi:hypothetical protein
MRVGACRLCHIGVSSFSLRPTEGTNMAKASVLALLLALAGCSAAPLSYSNSDPCSGGREITRDCQVLRYHNGT